MSNAADPRAERRPVILPRLAEMKTAAPGDQPHEGRAG